MKKELLQKTQMKGVTMSKQDDLEIFDLIKEGLEDAIEFHKANQIKDKENMYCILCKKTSIFIREKDRYICSTCKKEKHILKN
jgi:predicted ribosome-associated RNA-binding protein Tma20